MDGLKRVVVKEEGGDRSSEGERERGKEISREGLNKIPIEVESKLEQ